MSSLHPAGRRRGREGTERGRDRFFAGRTPRPRRFLKGFGLLGPRHGAHTVPAVQLDALALPLGDDGVVIGVDAEGRPAVLGVNRPTPYDVVLIAGLWTAQVIALRAAATGARVAVETGRPQAWVQLVHAMGGGRTAWRCTTSGACRPRGRRRARRCWW